jgi:hypothetical protein
MISFSVMTLNGLAFSFEVEIMMKADQHHLIAANYSRKHRQ